MQLRNGFRIAFQFVFLPASTPETLREAANTSGLLFGACGPSYTSSAAAYAETRARGFNMVEPEDAMKWWMVRRDPNYFDFREADDVVDFAPVQG